MIINTQTSDLPGQHWIAVSIAKNGIVYAFDPLGFYYPPYLRYRLNNLYRGRVIYNRIMYQHPWENNCGQHCLNFLYKLSCGING